jgi:hypothetical protein
LPQVRIEPLEGQKQRVLINGNPLAEFDGPDAYRDAQRSVATLLQGQLERWKAALAPDRAPSSSFSLTGTLLQQRVTAAQNENARLRQLLDDALRTASSLIESAQAEHWRGLEALEPLCARIKNALAFPPPPAPAILSPPERNVVLEALRGRLDPRLSAPLLQRLAPGAPETEPPLSPAFSASNYERGLWKRALAAHPDALPERNADLHGKLSTQIKRMVAEAVADSAAGLDPYAEAEVRAKVRQYRATLMKNLEDNLPNPTPEQREAYLTRVKTACEERRQELRHKLSVPAKDVTLAPPAPKPQPSRNPSR